MKNFIEFEMDAFDFGIAEAEKDDLVLVTIDTVERSAWFVWYNPNNPEPMDNPANHPSMNMDYEETLELLKAKFLNKKYKINGYVIQYSDHPNYEYYAIVNGVLVDVSGYDWSGFDDFVEAAIEEFHK